MTLDYIPASSPDDEPQRLAALRRLDILDTPAEPAFDRIVDLASAMFGTSMAALSLIDADRQWFKAKVGLSFDETARDVSFCAHAILSGDVCLVPDATRDPRFRGNPLVTASHGIRFYAGAPLITREGYRLGTLCVIDTCPHPDFSAEDQRRLAEFAALAVDEFYLRSSNMVLEQQAAELRRAHVELELASRSRAAFFSAMRYKLRTPIDDIDGLTELIAAAMLDPGLRRYVELLRRSAAGMRRTIDTLISISGIDGDQLEANAGDFDLSEIVQSAVAGWVEEAQAKGLSLICRVDAELLCAVHADASWLRHLIDELVLNAIQFTAQGGVTVNVSRAPAARPDFVVARFEISDSGPGVSAALEREIFAAAAPRGESDGACYPTHGAGLVLCRRLVALMGGDIGVAAAPGGGAIFWFELPLRLSSIRVPAAHRDAAPA